MYSRTKSKRRSQTLATRQRGAALVVALLIFAICAALAVAMQSEFSRYFARSGNLLLAEQAHAYLRGAEDLASMALLVDYDNDKANPIPRDDLTEIWSLSSQAYPLEEGGWLRGSLEDLQGRFNLNSLQVQRRVQGQNQTAPKYTAAQKQFIRLLQALEEPPVSEFEAAAIAESIGDWLDSDNEPMLNGAEDDYYGGQQPSYRAGNQPMKSVSELLAVANMTPEIYVALAPWVTVWPHDPEPMNIHTAPAMLLRTLNEDDVLTPLSAEEAEILVEYRKENGFVDIKDLLQQPALSSKQQRMTETKKLLGETSSWFLLRAEVQLAERSTRLYSILKRHNNRRVSALVRASGSL